MVQIACSARSYYLKPMHSHRTNASYSDSLSDTHGYDWRAEGCFNTQSVRSPKSSNPQALHIKLWDPFGIGDSRDSGLFLFSTTEKLNKRCTNGKGQQIGIANIQINHCTQTLCKDTGNEIILCQHTKFA